MYPDAQQHKIWKNWLAGCRFVYNKTIERLKAGAAANAYDLKKTVLASSSLPDWVKQVPRHIKANAVMDAVDTWKQALANGGEASFRSCRQLSQAIKFDALDFKSGRWYPDLTKGMSFKTAESLPDFTLYGSQLVYDRHRWFAIMPRHTETQTTQQQAVIALDPGVRTFLTGYDGESVLEFGKADIGRIARLCLHLDDLTKRYDKKRVNAKRRRSMKRAANRIRIKIRNLVDEAHRKIACYLTRNYKLVYLPTFGTSEMVVRSTRKINSKSARQMLTWAYGRFKILLKSMAARRGVLVVETNEAFTSKTCTNCGHVHSKLGGAKVFKCPSCGFKIDRDWGGARNNMLRALGATPFSISNDGDAIVTFQLELGEIARFDEKGSA